MKKILFSLAILLNCQIALAQFISQPGCTINGGTITCGANSLTPSGTGLEVGNTNIADGVSGQILFDNGGVLGEKDITGTGNVVLQTSPTLTTPVLGVATATSINGNTITTGTGTLTIAAGKTITASNSLTLAGTDSTVFTFPNTTGTVATLAATQTFTNKTLTAPIISTISNTGVLTLPTSTDTLVGKATTDTLTNKTFNTSGTGNVFQIAGTGITAVTGSGSVVLASSPTLVTPVLGAATATTINGVTIAGAGTLNIPVSSTLTRVGTHTLTLTTAGTTDITFPTGSQTAATIGSTQTLANKTLTTPIIAAISNSGTLTLPTSTDTLVGKATTDTFTNKTFDTAGTGNSFSINSVAVTANTGTGAVARATSPTFVTPVLGVAAATSINLGQGAVSFLSSGTYTPTYPGGGTNVTAITANVAQYLRVGNTVTVSGRVLVTPTGAGTTVFQLTLPIASAFTSTINAGGVGASVTGTPAFFGIAGESTADNVEFTGATIDIVQRNFFYTFTYQVL